MLNLQLDIAEDFFKEEVRCGYTVSSEMKKVWAVALDLLNEFDRVCRKYCLSYYGSYGTLLGAIRHKGFIPWDDDIDLVMPRNDYSQLCAIAEEFQYPYFFQTEKTDPGFSRPFARLRNSNTAAFQKNEDYRLVPYNQGIFIDIFPLDSFPDSLVEQDRFKQDLVRANNKMSLFGRISFRYKKNESSGISSIVKNYVKEAVSPVLRFMMRKLNFGNPYVMPFERLSQKYNKFSSDEWFVAFFLSTKRQIIWEKRWFTRVCFADFEMLKIPVPGDFEKVLEATYKNWKELVKINSIHGEMFLDAEHSFIDYLGDDPKIGISDSNFC